MMDYRDVNESFKLLFDDFQQLDIPIRAMICADYMGSDTDIYTYVDNVGKDNVEIYAKTLVAGYSVRGVLS